MKVLLQLMPLADAPAHLAWLSEQERERLAQIGDTTRAAQYLAGHCLARALAAELCGGSAAQWQLVLDPEGRRCLQHARMPTLFTSISHAHASLAVAVGLQPMGVDLEAAGRDRDWLGLARTMFSAREVQVLSDTPDASRQSRFLATWTLKEAWAKRTGRGLQRQATRRWTAVHCTVADAEAWTWLLPDGGWLALAAATGAAVQVRGVAAQAGPWRYLENEA